jgi:hypothetical protein
MPTDASPAGRTCWSPWAAFLRRYGLESLAVWVLEASGPLALLGAQALTMASPLLQPAFTPGRVEALTSLLEDQDERLAFTEYLRKGMAG